MELLKTRCVINLDLFEDVFIDISNIESFQKVGVFTQINFKSGRGLLINLRFEEFADMFPNDFFYKGIKN